jgi:hypothetical protein
MGAVSAKVILNRPCGPASVQLSQHFRFRHRREVVDIETAGGKDRPHMSRYELVVKMRRNRQFYLHSLAQGRETAVPRPAQGR